MGEPNNAEPEPTEAERLRVLGGELCAYCGSLHMPRLQIRCGCMARARDDASETRALELAQEARRWAIIRGCPDARLHTVGAPCTRCPPRTSW